jgi:YVTN family beta-propeller protein
MRYFPMLVIVLLVGLAPIIVLAAPCAPPTLERPCAYTPNAASNDVSVIDTATDTVVATIPVGVHPKGVSIHPNGTRLYVTNSGDRTVSVIDTTTNMVINPPIVGLLGGASLSARGDRGGGTVPRCRYIPTHPRHTMRRCDTCPSGI